MKINSVLLNFALGAGLATIMLAVTPFVPANRSDAGARRRTEFTAAEISLARAHRVVLANTSPSSKIGTDTSGQDRGPSARSERFRIEK